MSLMGVKAVVYACCLRIGEVVLVVETSDSECSATEEGDFSFCLTFMLSALEFMWSRDDDRNSDKEISISMITGWWDELNSIRRSFVIGKKHFCTVCKTTSVLADFCQYSLYSAFYWSQWLFCHCLSSESAPVLTSYCLEDVYFWPCFPLKACRFPRILIG